MQCERICVHIRRDQWFGVGTLWSRGNKPGGGVGVANAASTPTPESLLESVTCLTYTKEYLHAILGNQFAYIVLSF